MEEKFSRETGVENEQYVFEIFEVSADSVFELESLRRDIDGEEGVVSDKFAKELLRYQEGGESKAFVMRNGEKAVGYIEVDLHDDYLPKGADTLKCAELKDFAHIARVGVLESARGNHVGKRLLERAEEWAVGHGASAIWLDYLGGKENLVGFYESSGYETLDEFTDVRKNKIRCIAVKRF
jgi:diamine N-acetyltransferase